MRRSSIRLLLAFVPAVLAFAPAREAHAQTAATSNTALPDVLLLLDTSGSMERMLDGSMPSDNKNPLLDPNGAATNVCSPGNPSNPNRWGNLVQALTGNLQPYYSCWAMNRATNGPLFYEYGIGGQKPYDTDYALPYHRPLSGTGATTCAWAPNELAGASGGAGVGVNKRGAAGTVASDFPPTSFTAITYSALSAAPSAGYTPSTLNACTFSQARDGQLDAARDYIRFSLMTFDTDTDGGIGVNVSNPPGGSVLTGANQPFAGLWSYVAQAPIPGVGKPAGCLTAPPPFDVGARHWAAPPWEGRHVPFADPLGTLYDVQRTNDQIQQVIMGTRPFGATPIDGLVADARDYYWKNAYGPNGTIAGYSDAYFKNACRDAYIVLLTDGAPNLNLRPQCGTGAGSGGGVCPYPQQAYEMANDLFNGNGGPKVTTFVIGFSVSGSGTFPGDGFPSPYDTAPLNKCKAWYEGAAPGGGGTAQGMNTACINAKAAGKAPTGSTADACCQLNQIAFNGTGANGTSTGAFFAESQAEIDVALGQILAKISKTASSRTPPAYSPVVSVQNHGVAARYVTSFIPNARRPWSGEIDRTRSSCNTSPPGLDVAQSEGQGDSYAQDLAAQTALKTRFFISVDPNLTTGTYRDGLRSIRPYSSATTYDDGINGTNEYSGTEVADVNMGLIGSAGWQQAMDIDDNTCPRSRVPDPSDPTHTKNKVVPNLTGANCMKAIWGFTVAQPDPMNLVGSDGVTNFNFNVRCQGGGAGLTSGTCSISTATTCVVGASPSTCPIKGEVCVPDCAALGAIYHSTPAVAGPPSAFLRDDAYRTFAQGRANRRPMMFTATTDGILHAFKALETVGGSEGGNGKSANWEIWGFIPPAVLPNLAANFPSGQQILLDGSPVVKDVVWDRATVGNGDQWHSMLVAGMGTNASGYYALNVSDGDCGDTCSPATWQAAANYADASIGGANTAKRGPHFMWQLTDVPKTGAGDNGIVVRQEKGATPVPMVALFGKQSATPAITQVSVDPDGNGVRQMGIAILPGGIDGAPVAGPGCTRGIFSGYQTSKFDRSDPAKPARNQVRRWAASCAPNDPNSRVAGRNVMIVRVDTGEILRNFGRLSTLTPETPALIVNKTTDTPFDSPMVGTPAVFPSGAGENAQRVFIGDADGTLWSIDLTSTDPTQWQATLFQDLFSGGTPADSQPIVVPINVSQDSGGAFVVNAATGDQENIVASAATNYVYSVREVPSFVLAVPSKAQVQWFKPLLAGERVTGPMVVFDRTLYFATFKPDALNNVCGGGAVAKLWGMDYLNPQTGAPPSNAGGAWRWCPSGSVSTAGQCLTAFTDSETSSVPNSIISGVTLRPSLACTQFGSVGDDPTGGITGVTPQTYELFFSLSAPRGANGLPTPQAERKSMAIQVPKVSAMVDAWSLVFD